MKILNGIIEDSKIFGKELFGDLRGLGEPDTEEEKEVLKALNAFFNTFIAKTSEVKRNEILPHLEKLYKEKDKFKELQYSGKYVYRYSNFGSHSYIEDIEIDLKRTLSNNGKEIYICGCEYKPNAEIQSWTTQPYSKTIINRFNKYGTILLRSDDVEHTFMTDYFSNTIKKLGTSNDFSDEFEVLKWNKKKWEKVDIVVGMRNYITTSISDDFYNIFVDKVDEKYNLSTEMYKKLKGCYKYECIVWEDFLNVINEIENRVLNENIK